MKFRKKPVIIEAVQWTGKNHSEIFSLFGDFGNHIFNLNGTMTIKTLEGDHTALIGDWIIKGVKGEFYPCKNDVFLKSYTKVEK